MRDVSRLRWLEGRLWMLFAVAVVFVLYGMMPWHGVPGMSFHYIRVSRTGVLTTATVVGQEGWVHPRSAYAYAASDGTRHRGKADGLEGQAGEAILVYYLPGEPDVSMARDQWWELEQLAILVFLGLACGTSLLRRIRRRRPA
jgi:hypothetical protein